MSILSSARSEVLVSKRFNIIGTTKSASSVGHVSQIATASINYGVVSDYLARPHASITHIWTFNQLRTCQNRRNPEQRGEEPTSHKTLCFGDVELVPGASNLVPASNTLANILANVALVLKFASLV